ncbi:MAG: threonine synthase [Neisseriaceae bacterium]|nr:threonine synthase [Neisseriaceae bacterium]
MNYISTRGGMAPQSFSDILLMGLAPDGGLVMPMEYPQVSAEQLETWRTLSYPELAYEIISLFATDIPAQDLKDILAKTYTEDCFGTKAITPVRRLQDGIVIQALSNGPTLAFKDMAMQFLGHMFEYVLAKKQTHINIIGATSGDTGSAAEYAMKGKAGINIFMLSPNGKMSAFQRAQMYSLQDENIHNIAIDGLFDDCQDIVKATQQDAAFKERYKIGTVNSINWGRIVAQIVYYFKGYFEATSTNEQKVSFCVPSGNFGNVCAGHIARQMGLHIHRLIVATNENDVLDEFFKTGIYRPRGSADTYITSSPSMDISKASNFERFIFDLVGQEPEAVNMLWAKVASGEGFDLSEYLPIIQEYYGFVSGKSTHADRLATIRSVYQSDGAFIDTHTADGIKVAREMRDAGELVVCLETALAIKFEDTLKEALGDDVVIPCPKGLMDLGKRPQKVVVLPNDAGLVKKLIEETLA